MNTLIKLIIGITTYRLIKASNNQRKGLNFNSLSIDVAGP